MWKFTCQRKLTCQRSQFLRAGQNIDKNQQSEQITKDQNTTLLRHNPISDLDVSAHRIGLTIRHSL